MAAVSRETTATSSERRSLVTALPLGHRATPSCWRGPGVERGLLGPREADRLWERHLLNCAVVADLVPRGAVGLRRGRGAGLPGLVLAIVRPDLRVILVEPLLRRITFLHEAVAALGLERERRARASRDARERDSRRRRRRPRCRSVGQTGALVPASAVPGGSLLALKGVRAQAELADAEPELPGLGASSWTVLQVGGDRLSEPTTVVRMLRAGKGEAAHDSRRPRPDRSARDGHRQLCPGGHRQPAREGTDNSAREGDRTPDGPRGRRLLGCPASPPAPDGRVGPGCTGSPGHLRCRQGRGRAGACRPRRGDVGTPAPVEA